MPRKHLILKGYRKKNFCLSEYTMKNMVLCAVGMACACLIANMTRHSIFAGAADILKQITDVLSQKGLEKSEVALYSFTTNGKFALLLFFFSFTNAWWIYSRCFVFYIGFLQGVLLSCCLFLKGFSGIFFYLALLVPHAFLLAPAYLFLMQRLESWHRSVPRGENGYSSRSESASSKKKKQMVLQILPLFLGIMILLFLGTLLEGYLNVPVLRIFHS